jgi:hypothetical protein
MLYVQACHASIVVPWMTQLSCQWTEASPMDVMRGVCYGGSHEHENQLRSGRLELEAAAPWYGYT